MAERDVYVARDYNGTILSIVCATSEEYAVAYWQGAGLIPHSIRVINTAYETGSPVIPVLNTRVLSRQDLDACRRDVTRRDSIRVIAR